MTYQQRYFPTNIGGVWYAPSTIGCPANIISVDHSVFKKSMDEKMKLYTFKKQHPKTKHTKFKVVLKASF